MKSNWSKPICLRAVMMLWMVSMEWASCVLQKIFERTAVLRLSNKWFSCFDLWNWGSELSSERPKIELQRIPILSYATLFGYEKCLCYIFLPKRLTWSQPVCMRTHLEVYSRLVWLRLLLWRCLLWYRMMLKLHSESYHGSTTSPILYREGKLATSLGLIWVVWSHVTQFTYHSFAVNIMDTSLCTM